MVTDRVKILRNNVLHHFAKHVSQSKISASVTVRQFLMIYTEEVKDRCVQIVNRDSVLDSLEAEFISGTIYNPGFDAATGHPHRISVGIVVTPVTFGHRCTAEFTTPYNERLIQQSASFQISNESPGGTIHVRTASTVVLVNLSVIVPTRWHTVVAR